MDLLPGELCAQLARLDALLQPHRERLDETFAGCYGALERRALAAISLASAARLFAADRAPAEFLEEVEYHGRRLAKLNLPPEQAAQFLAAYGAAAGAALGPCGAAWEHAVEQLRLRTLLALDRAYYEVREAETQAFYGLFRAEVEARDLEDLLSRFMAILTRTLRAGAGRLMLAGPGLSAVLKKLSQPLYVEGGKPEEALILDPAMRGRHACYWSVPFRHGDRVGAVAQFGFAVPYPWLPRELSLLEAAAERCLASVERARLVRDLAARERQVRQLAAHLIGVEEEERRRISRELHDEAGQCLLLLRLQLEGLERDCPEDSAWRSRLAESRELAERAVAEVRRAVSALSPALLERLGLPSAIRHLSARFGKVNGLAVRLRLPEACEGLSLDIRTVAYRLAQECFNNIAKHAAATCVNLSLRLTDRWLELSVRDNGAGFDVTAALEKPDCFGLAGMRERVSMLGGTLEIHSRPGRGAQILARLPREAGGRIASNVNDHGEDTSTSHG